MRFLVAVGLVIAVATGTTSAGRGDLVSPADARRILHLFDLVADAMVAHPYNCPRLASRINEVVDGNRATIRRAAEAKAGGKRLPKRVQQRMLARVKGMLPAMEHCGTNRAVMDALQRLDGKAIVARSRRTTAQR